MSIAVQPADSTRAISGQLAADAHYLARALLVGAAVGLVSLGILGRLAMFLLAKTNPSTAGMVTDDGFVIDQFTLSGSVQLAMTGAVFGALSGAIYAGLAPLKTGPVWFQRLSLSVGGGVVVASQVIHSDGVDFVFLDRPVFAAIALFLVIPVLHVLALDLLIERVRRRRLLAGSGWTAAGLLLTVPASPAAVPLTVARLGQLALRSRAGEAAWLHPDLWRWIGRAVLTVVFALAVASIVGDVRALG